MTAGGTGRYAKQHPPGIGQKSPLVSEYSTILFGKLVSRRGICFPETSQNAMPGLRDASPVPQPTPGRVAETPPWAPALSSQTLA